MSAFDFAVHSAMASGARQAPPRDSSDASYGWDSVGDDAPKTCAAWGPGERDHWVVESSPKGGSQTQGDRQGSQACPGTQTLTLNNLDSFIVGAQCSCRTRQ